MIRKLLEKNPEKRLGGGKLGSDNDILKVKEHPFFENIDFNNLLNIDPPINIDQNFNSPFIYVKYEQNSVSPCIKRPTRTKTTILNEILPFNLDLFNKKDEHSILEGILFN